MRRTLASLLAVLICCLGLQANAAHTTASLLLDASTAKPGDTVLAGVRLQIESGWHTYWINSGTYGGPLTIKWDLPPGLTAGEIQWPVPEKKLTDSDVSYAYTEEVVLLVPLKLAADVKPATLDLKARLVWIECDTGNQCVKSTAAVSAKLTIGDTHQPSADAPLFEAAKAGLPKPAGDLKVTATWEKVASDDARALVLEWPSANAGNPDFFPLPVDNLEFAGKTEILSQADGKTRIRKSVKKLDGDWPNEIGGLLISESNGKREAFEVKLPITTSPASTAPAAASAPTSASPPQGTEPLWLNLVYAFIGGMILNIMPCVFPVIALKIFGFVQQSHDEPRRIFRLGLIYALGVIASFLVMAGIIIAIKQAGGSAITGMQFKNPYISVAFIVLVVLIALNLFGIFEVNLGGGTMDAAGQLASKQGAPGAFFNGIVTTILATPCTAPVLAIALGYAYAQPPLVILIFFFTIGLGLAFPYVLLSWKPGWLKLLPKPGPWMEKFKIAMGFPVLATAVWIFWFTAPRFGEDGVIWLGFFLIGVSLAAWIWGTFVQRGTKRRGLAIFITALVLVVSYAYALESELHWRSPNKKTTEVNWQPWSHEAVAKARSQGSPVLVDFTAKWCPTCNKFVKPVVNSSEVQRKLTEVKGVALLADFTEYPADMEAEIKKYHADGGIPLVLVFPKDPAQPPIVLSVKPSRADVVEALDKAAR